MVTVAMVVVSHVGLFIPNLELYNHSNITVLYRSSCMLYLVLHGDCSQLDNRQRWVQVISKQ